MHKTEPLEVTREQISEFVETFYDLILRDQRLGPIFRNEIGGNWSVHLEKMKRFWCAVLLKTKEYSGRPIPAHTKLQGVKTDDFRKWLGLFRQTAVQVFEPEVAATATQSAENIASSLWLAMNAGSFSAPPKWSEAKETARQTQP